MLIDIGFEVLAAMSINISLSWDMEATCSSETSVDFERTTRRYIPGHKTLHITRFSGSIECVECLDKMSHYQLLKGDRAAGS
jgi:hypothetical protein